MTTPDCPFLVDCPESMLGTLGKKKSRSVNDMTEIGDGIEVNGVFLPHTVAQQLQMLGKPLESYSRGELYDAIMACAEDGVLVDDPDGDNFQDKLTLTPEEMRLRAHAHGDHTFCDNEEDRKKYKNSVVPDSM